MKQGKIPFFTYAMIAICVIVYLVSMVNPSLSSMLAVSVPAVMSGHVWTIVTSMFEHGGVWHIVMNMMMLYYMGTALERIFGPVKTGIVYLGSGILGNVAYVAVNMALGSPASAVGASGAIFGLIGMYAVMLLMEMKEQRMLAVRPTFQSASGFFICLAMNVAISFVPGIAWQAHFGGLLGGAILGLVMYLVEIKKYPKRPQ